MTSAVAFRYPNSMENSKGRAPNDNEESQLSKCTFKTPGGVQLGNNLQCVTARGASELGIGAVRCPLNFAILRLCLLLLRVLRIYNCSSVGLRGNSN